MSNNNYNELVDYQVQSMNRFESLSDTMTEPPFNTQAYENYKDQVKQYQLNTNGNLTEMILKLGFKLDQQWTWGKFSPVPYPLLSRLQDHEQQRNAKTSK